MKLLKLREFGVNRILQFRNEVKRFLEMLKIALNREFSVNVNSLLELMPNVTCSTYTEWKLHNFIWNKFLGF